MQLITKPQTLVKNPTEAGMKKKSTPIIKFIEELAKIGNSDQFFLWICTFKLIYSREKSFPYACTRVPWLQAGERGRQKVRPRPRLRSGHLHPPKCVNFDPGRRTASPRHRRQHRQGHGAGGGQDQWAGGREGGGDGANAAAARRGSYTGCSPCRAGSSAGEGGRRSSWTCEGLKVMALNSPRWSIRTWFICFSLIICSWCNQLVMINNSIVEFFSFNLGGAKCDFSVKWFLSFQFIFYY